METGKPAISFIGLGNMGDPMCRNLLSAGFPLTVFNRTHEKMTPLVQAGALAASSIADACKSADIVFTMLSNDQALESICFAPDGLLAHMNKNAIHMAGNLSPPLSPRAAHRETRPAHVAAPVLAAQAAAAKRLTVLAAGDERAVAQALCAWRRSGSAWCVLATCQSANVAKLYVGCCLFVVVWFACCVLCAVCLIVVCCLLLAARLLVISCCLKDFFGCSYLLILLLTLPMHVHWPST